MSDGVRETQCTKCAHRHVCKYKDMYLKALETVLKTEITQHDKSNGISITPITELEFLNPIELDCKHQTNLIQTKKELFHHENN